MRLDELKMDSNMEPELAKDFTSAIDSQSDIAAFLRKKKWKVVGHGAYSIVLDKPGTNYVIKINKYSDIAFHKFAKLCHKYKNPHFPVISSARKLTEGSGAKYMYLIEKLTPITDPFLEDFMLRVVKFYDAKVPMKYLTWKMNDVQKTYLEDNPKLLEAIEILHENMGKMLSDAYPQNCMMRGDTLVVIDPYVTNN